MPCALKHCTDCGSQFLPARSRDLSCNRCKFEARLRADRAQDAAERIQAEAALMEKAAEEAAGGLPAPPWRPRGLVLVTGPKKAGERLYVPDRRQEAASYQETASYSDEII